MLSSITDYFIIFNYTYKRQLYQMARFLKNFGLQSWKLKTGSAMAPILISYRVFTILYSVFSRTRPKDFQSSILRKVL